MVEQGSPTAANALQYASSSDSLKRGTAMYQQIKFWSHVIYYCSTTTATATTTIATTITAAATTTTTTTTATTSGSTNLTQHSLNLQSR